jgi:hypothetical protein
MQTEKKLSLSPDYTKPLKREKHKISLKIKNKKIIWIHDRFQNKFQGWT